MERLNERISTAKDALSTLEKILMLESFSDIERDACIQRFEYSFEAIWKAVKAYLFSMEGLEANSPKSVVRASFQVGLLTEEQSRNAMLMVDDRNLTSHTYNEGLAAQIMSRIPAHTKILQAWLSAIVT